MKLDLKHLLEGKITIPNSGHHFHELKAKLIHNTKNYTNPVCLKLETKNKRGEQAHIQPSYKQSVYHRKSESTSRHLSHWSRSLRSPESGKTQSWGLTVLTKEIIGFTSNIIPFLYYTLTVTSVMCRGRRLIWRKEINMEYKQLWKKAKQLTQSTKFAKPKITCLILWCKFFFK